MPELANQTTLEILHARGLEGRDLSLRAQSINEEERSFEAVMSTETPARMVDWSRLQLIDEILLARGGEFPSDGVPLLRNHQRYELDDVIGSARQFRLEGDVGPWVGRGFLAEPEGEDDPVRRYWSRIKQGHLRAVSIGYEVTEFTDLEPGQKKQVAGRYFTAKQRRLRISTRWRVHEVSLTPIGADPLALIRSRITDPAPAKRSYFR